MIYLQTKTFKKQPVKKVMKNPPGEGIPVKISRKDTGNQIRRKDSVHLQEHGCKQVSFFDTHNIHSEMTKFDEEYHLHTDNFYRKFPSMFISKKKTLFF